MMNKPHYIYTLILLLLGTNASGQESYTLQKVLERIDQQHPGLQQYALKSEAADELAKGAKAWEAPRISAGVDEFPYPNKMMHMEGDARKMLMVGIDQMIPNRMQQRTKAAYQSSFKKQYEHERGISRNALYAQAKTAFYDRYISLRRIGLLDEQEKAMKLMLEVAEASLAYSKSDLPEVYSARAKLGSLEQMRLKEQGMVNQADQRLNALMNRSGALPLSIDTVGVSLNHYQEITASAVIENQVTQRSDIQKMEAEIRTMALNKAIMGTMNKPMWGIGTKQMRMPNGMYMLSAMVDLTIPFAPWAAKGYQSEIKAMDRELEAMRKAKEAMQSMNGGMIRAAMADLQAQYQSIALFESRILPDYRKTLDAYMTAYGENRGDLLRVLMAWDDLLMKRMEFLDALGETFRMEVMYAEAMEYAAG